MYPLLQNSGENIDHYFPLTWPIDRYTPRQVIVCQVWDNVEVLDAVVSAIDDTTTVLPEEVVEEGEVGVMVLGKRVKP